MSWVDKLERRFGKFAIKNLMKYIVAITGFVFILKMLFGSEVIINSLVLVPELVYGGQIWRLITYIFIPPDSSTIWILFILYFYYIIGTSLENEWGSFKFNLYYFLGMMGTTLVVLLTKGTATSTYINLSLFLAFAHIYPNYEVLLFFILPIKVKYLGWINWVYIIMTIITQPFSYKIAAIVSIINFFIFFGGEIALNAKIRGRSQKSKRKFNSQVNKSTLRHKCTICGMTPDDDPNMDFRYCPDCYGLKCYCSKHIKNHEHIRFDDTRPKIIEFPTKKKTRKTEEDFK